MNSTWHKWLAVTLALTTTLAPLSVSAAAGTPTYHDLGQADAWATASIEQTQTLGLMSGDGDGNFRPQATITREEAAAVLARTLHLPTPASKTSSFRDVNVADWSHSVVEAMAQAGLMAGDGDGTFRPQDVITREEMAVLLVKATSLKPATGDNISVADATRISSWAKGYVQTALETGLLHGDGTHFNPQAHATRQEVALMAINLYQRQTATQVISSLSDDGVVIGGVTYSVDKSLQGLLTPTNADVLKNARIRFEADGTRLTQIKELELTTSGVATTGLREFSGNLVLDGHGGSIDGNLTISADYISVQNVSIHGDLTISPALKNDFYSKNMQVGGRTEVAGGTSNTVVFEDATLHQMHINKENVHVVPTGTTKISEVVVSTNAVLAPHEVAFGANRTFVANAILTISKLTVESNVTQFEVNVPVQQLELAGKTTKVLLGESAKIDTIILPEGVQLADVIPNYDAHKNAIGKVEQKKADGTTVPYPTTTPAPAGGGGGGGGSTPTPVPPVNDSIIQSVRAVNTTTIEVTFKKPTYPQNITFDHGLQGIQVLYSGRDGFGPITKAIFRTSPQQALTYQVLLDGKQTGLTFQGIVPQKFGQVKHADGTAFAGTTITLQDAQTYEVLEDSSTDEQGHFALSGMQEGHDYILNLPLSNDMKREMDPGSIRFTYHAANPLPDTSYLAPKLVGRVVNPDGTPIAYASLTFTDKRAFTDADGYYYLAGVTDGDTYYVKVELPSSSEYAAPPEFYYTYTDGTTILPDIYAHVPTMVGTVRNEQGQPVAGQRVWVYRYGRTSIMTSDEQGHFKYFTPEDGNYVVRVFAQELDPFADSLYSDFTISQGKLSSNDFVVVMPAVTLKGHAYKPDGQPARDTQISLYDSYNNNVYNMFTSSSGLYKIGGVPSGTYTLKASSYPDRTLTYTTTVTIAKNHVLEQDVHLVSPPPPKLSNLFPTWNHLHVGDLIQAETNVSGDIFLVSTDVDATDMQAVIEAIWQRKAISRRAYEPGAVAFFTNNLLPERIDLSIRIT